MDLQLDGKTAFISGSTQGIGFAIAQALAGEGVNVTLHGRDRIRLDRAIAVLQHEAPATTVTGVVADFAHPAQVDRVAVGLGKLDILINNVGVFELKPFDEISDDDWGRYFEVNVMSGVRLARRALPGMLERDWGRIIFLNSESALNVPAEMIHYGATKAALLAVGNGLAKLTKGTRVTVNSVLGGPTYSDGVAQAVDALAELQGLPVEAIKQSIIGSNQTTLLGRFIEPGEIAGMVTFLASPAAAATNGSAVRVDGGVLTTLT
jgi:NAD(P)-dependent dehydrogenase (short-subunit alcohol dehydrogenase family)